MKQILVISGKGGTGKTVITASFASIVKNKVLADCDVDAADLHILLKPTVEHSNIFTSGKTAKIHSRICSQCGECIRACRFNAMNKDFSVDRVLCEGCALCSHICPEGAITMDDNVSGEWYVSSSKYGPMIHAKLGIAEENSGKLVSKVKETARQICESEKKDYIIIDGPPGTGCPVIASLSGVDLAVIVTEPTISGIHDMERVLQISNHFKIEPAVIINKYDLNLHNTGLIQEICGRDSITVLGKLPFDPIVSRSIVEQTPLPKYGKNNFTGLLKEIWDKIK